MSGKRASRGRGRDFPRQRLIPRVTEPLPMLVTAGMFSYVDDDTGVAFYTSWDVDAAEDVCILRAMLMGGPPLAAGTEYIALSVSRLLIVPSVQLAVSSNAPLPAVRLTVMGADGTVFTLWDAYAAEVAEDMCVWLPAGPWKPGIPMEFTQEPKRLSLVGSPIRFAEDESDCTP